MCYNETTSNYIKLCGLRQRRHVTVWNLAEIISLYGIEIMVSISFITLGASIFACIFWFINDLPVGIKAMGICLILVAIVISGATFCFITNRYPRNNTKEYFCNFKTAKFISDEMSSYQFVLEKAEEKVYGLCVTEKFPCVLICAVICFPKHTSAPFSFAISIILH